MSKHSLIINSPYAAPSGHWQFVEQGAPLELAAGRRIAGYMIADPKAKPHLDKGIFVELPMVNKIRQRVDKWRQDGYPEVTGITKTLLDHWHDNEQRDFPFFFCQLEAIETLIWLIETTDSEKNGIDIPKDGALTRVCSKLATGTGKTVVMAMLIAWQAINRVTYPQDGRFSQNVFIVAPNLTVRERLAVLHPANQQNYYDEFGIVPRSLREKLRQAKVQIRNWHALNWDSDEKIKNKKSVDKRGAKSDEAYAREVLGDMANARNLIVINDEAHHAWRVPAETKITGIKKEEIDEATKWVGGLERINKTRGILQCFDFSATPFAPSDKKTEALFGWIVSDFGLNDAIESGLVKTPRVVVRDNALPDAKTYKSRLYHIYNDGDVKDDLNRKAAPSEGLPSLVVNAYVLLGSDWAKTQERWQAQGMKTPPVMITIANRTETAARIKYAFDHQKIPMVNSLGSPEGILHIDSTVLKKAEEEAVDAETPDKDVDDNGTKRTTKKVQAETLREKVNTVGQEGKAGEQVQNVISVGMLSEGWDARTVTQIMGLRAFTSQLLCEQVIGRGLRRASYEINEKTKLFDPEYVNVFGVPFSFLPHEEEKEGEPSSTAAKTSIYPEDAKKQFAISWPNVIRVDRTYKPKLSIDLAKVKTLTLNTATIIDLAEIAPTVNNRLDISNITDIDIEKLMAKSRQQTLIFKAAQNVWQQMQPNWPAPPAILMAELVRLAEQFLDSNCIQITPALFNQNAKMRHLVITLNMANVIRHFWDAIKFSNTEKTALVLDDNYPICTTGDMRSWKTGKPHSPTQKSHINYCVFDSTWESSEAFALDHHKAVAAWVKNDHLGFEVMYTHDGAVKKYRPDFLIRMTSGDMLVLETKGQQTEQDQSKHSFMHDWVRAVSDDGQFGRWHFAISKTPADIKDILAKRQ